MKLFVEIVHDFEILTTFAKSSTSDARLFSEYAFELSSWIHLLGLILYIYIDHYFRLMIVDMKYPPRVETGIF